MTTTPMLIDNTALGSVDSEPRIANVAYIASEHSRKIRNSALWAAYGDALGWISELTDATGLKRRLDGAPLCEPVAWERRIGGRSGVTASLPAGCYSDDTQLRLATSRAIRAGGFDVDAFAKVELPVWLSYALGGGIGSSKAAENMAKPKKEWWHNNFKGWTDSGGNGAAMRVQPHVWVAHAPEQPESFLLDVIRNAVCTHSHPTGIMGAVIHALTLAHTMTAGAPPLPEYVMNYIAFAASIPEFMRGDFELHNYWRTAFERDAGPFGEAWERAISDSRNALQAVISCLTEPTGEERYSAIIAALNLREKEHIGNGIRTAIAAVGLTWCETQPAAALRIAANALGTDTDTIATMAGAILGVTAETEPPVEVLDADLIRSEADRLSRIAQGERPPSHRYPDLLRWSAPKTRSDALMQTSAGRLYVCGLGFAEAKGEPIVAPKGGFMWQWLNLESGQTLLIKRREALLHYDAAPASLAAEPAPSPAGDSGKQNQKAQPDTPTRFADVNPKQAAPPPVSRAQRPPIDLDKALNYIRENTNDANIGSALRGVVARGTTGQIAAFTAALIDFLREMEDAKVSEQSSP